MSVKTSNIYGRIIISDKAIERFTYHIANDCYGIVEFVPRNLWDAICTFIKFRSGVKGIKASSKDDRINIEVSVVVKYGVSIKAVAEALKESIKYKVEHFTGMIVDNINVNIMGIRQ